MITDLLAQLLFPITFRPFIPGYEGELVSKCEEKVDISEENTDKFIGLIPVLLNNITYRNVYCAICNADVAKTPADPSDTQGYSSDRLLFQGGRVINVNSSFWSVGFSCVGNNLISTGNIQYILQTVSRCEWGVFPGEDGTREHLRPCGENLVEQKSGGKEEAVTGAQTVSSCGVANSIKGRERWENEGETKAEIIVEKESFFPSLASSLFSSSSEKRDKNERHIKGEKQQNHRSDEGENRINNERNLTPSVYETLSYACNYYQYQYTSSIPSDAYPPTPEKQGTQWQQPIVPPHSPSSSLGAAVFPTISSPDHVNFKTDVTAPFPYPPHKSQEVFNTSSKRRAQWDPLSQKETVDIFPGTLGDTSSLISSSSSSSSLLSSGSEKTSNLHSPETVKNRETAVKSAGSSDIGAEVSRHVNSNHYYNPSSISAQQSQKGSPSVDASSPQYRVTFKNHHCALCNGVLPIHLSCNQPETGVKRAVKYSPPVTVASPFSYYSELSQNPLRHSSTQHLQTRFYSR